MTTQITSDHEWIKAAAAYDRDALIDDIKAIYNCHEVDVSAAGDVWIRNPQQGRWLSYDSLTRCVRNLKTGDAA
jgi:hypothetical protein